MAMYEPFNRTLKNKLRSFYEYNKEIIAGGAIVLALFGGSLYLANKIIGEEFKKAESTLEKAVDSWPEGQSLQEHYNEIYDRNKH